MEGDLEERLALDALGLLSEDEQAEVRLAAKGLPGAAAYYDAAATLAVRFPPVQPPPALREAILERITTAQRAPTVSPQLTFIGRDEGWFAHPLVPGIQVKQLALDQVRGVATILMNVAPGTVYPAHHHQGHEECYVISGDLHVAGRALGPGDFHHADAGSDHGTLHTVGGCTVLLVVDAHDYLG